MFLNLVQYSDADSSETVLATRMTKAERLYCRSSVSYSPETVFCTTPS